MGIITDEVKLLLQCLSILVDNAKAVEIISDEAVQAALTADLGKDAKLDSWKGVPFTKKGDNYASYVTGIVYMYICFEYIG